MNTAAHDPLINSGRVSFSGWFSAAAAVSLTRCALAQVVEGEAQELEETLGRREKARLIFSSAKAVR